MIRFQVWRLEKGGNAVWMGLLDGSSCKEVLEKSLYCMKHPGTYAVASPTGGHAQFGLFVIEPVTTPNVVRSITADDV